LPSRPPRDSSGRRAWGRTIRVTNRLTGRSIVVEQWDLGPGRRAQSRGVVIDLTPAAFLALGGRLQAGRLSVSIEVL
jgi:rare lipoprotein A (peptidoglycan hydrolase)